MTMSRWIWILLLTLGCGGSSGESPAGSVRGADAIATYSGGAIGFDEIEAAFLEARTPACLAARRARGGGSIEELMPCYREVAEDLTLEKLVLAEVGDLEEAVQGIEGYPQLRRHAYREAFSRRLAEEEEAEIEDDAIEAHYEANRQKYRRPGSLNLWNIFRRHDDPEKPEETLAFLVDLKKRYLAGETFSSLARAHSHSETRLRDGQVGQILEGRLPARLEKVAFALGDGDVSDPIAVRGGAVLLHVRNVNRPADLSLDDVRETIRRELRAQALAERFEQQVAGVSPPDDAVVLEPDEIFAALDEGDAEDPILDLQGDRMTVGQARQLAGLGDDQGAADLDDDTREALLAAYEQRRKNGLLVADLLATADPELRAEAEEHLKEQAVATLVDQRLRQETEVFAAIDAETLETYYQDNLPHYQSPLKFRLHLWDLPFGANPPRQLRRMEKIREALAAGEIRLSEAAKELGGSVRDLGWKDIGELEEIQGKARQYLLQTEAGGFSIPYQDEDALHMQWIEAREEPRPMTYEEAADRVRADYLKRFEEQLFRQAAETRLAGAKFNFDEEAVRRVLAPVTEGE